MQFTTLNIGRLASLAIITAGNVMGHPSVLQRQVAPISLGSAATFGAIAATTITNTGGTVVTGDCGVCPGTAMTGFGPGQCTGITSLATTPGCNAAAACNTSYNAAVGLVPTLALPSSDLAGMHLAPGVFTFPSSGVMNTAILTLNGTSNPSGQFIFQITTTLSTAVNSQVVLVGGALASNVFFIVGSSATIGGGSIIAGSVLAHTAVSIASAAQISGTVCAINAAVNLMDNAITA